MPPLHGAPVLVINGPRRDEGLGGVGWRPWDRAKNITWRGYRSRIVFLQLSRTKRDKEVRTS